MKQEKRYLIYHNTIKDRGFLEELFMTNIKNNLNCKWTMKQKEAIKIQSLEKALYLCDFLRNAGFGMCKVWECSVEIIEVN